MMLELMAYIYQTISIPSWIGHFLTEQFAYIYTVENVAGESLLSTG